MTPQRSTRFAPTWLQRHFRAYARRHWQQYSIVELCGRAGIGRTTFYRWCRLPGFAEWLVQPVPSRVPPVAAHTQQPSGDSAKNATVSLQNRNTVTSRTPVLDLQQLFSVFLAAAASGGSLEEPGASAGGLCRASKPALRATNGSDQGKKWRATDSVPLGTDSFQIPLQLNQPRTPDFCRNPALPKSCPPEPRVLIANSQ